MTDILWNLASFIVALGILVAVHEFGHFWVARRCGVYVEKFSIGFGKSIWSKVGKDGTEYSISMIPLGGYVKMLDSRVDEVSEVDHKYAFDKKPLWKRTAIVGAGPAFNFFFAVFAYWLVFLIGVPAVKPVVGEVTPSSIAAQAGLEPGMQILSVDGKQTLDWESVNLGLVSHIGDSQMTITVSSESQIGMDKKLTLDLQTWNFNPETESAMGTLGFVPFSPEIKMTLVNVSADGAGAQAGLLVGDTITQIDGVAVESWKQVVEAIQGSANTPLPMTVNRAGESVSVTLVPGSRELADGSNIGFAGIAPELGEWPADYRFDLQYGPVEAVGKAIVKTGQIIELTMTMLKKLIVGDVG
ncbi:membrane-associated zinc metalloprotease [Vibrio variabilis]|uniref:Zinc metalloprotease n=1 Tax=Vibrio variabilis TaxID=990271 RepID=A0ABQ0J4P8_9VIBR|nr:membrane-associated zinc metalloprotease [Vibrio variabilis]